MRVLRTRKVYQVTVAFTRPSLAQRAYQTSAAFHVEARNVQSAKAYAVRQCVLAGYLVRAGQTRATLEGIKASEVTR